MKQLEIKKVTPGSAFKVTLYFAAIPVALMILVGIIALLIGIASGNRGAAMFGGMYLIAPAIMFFVYGAFSALIALLYNVLANRFGGLEIVVDEDDVDAYDI